MVLILQSLGTYERPCLLPPPQSTNLAIQDLQHRTEHTMLDNSESPLVSLQCLA